MSQIISSNETMKEGKERYKAGSGAKVQKLPYPLDGPSLSKADNAKTEAESNEMAKTLEPSVPGTV